MVCRFAALFGRNLLEPMALCINECRYRSHLHVRLFTLGIAELPLLLYYFDTWLSYDVLCQRPNAALSLDLTMLLNIYKDDGVAHLRADHYSPSPTYAHTFEHHLQPSQWQRQAQH